MAHNSALVSIAIMVGLIPQPSPSPVGLTCIKNDEKVASFATFREHGTRSGDFVLSLSVLQPMVSAGSAITVALELEVLSKKGIDILTSLPSAAYDVAVDDEQTFMREPHKADYLMLISQIRLDHISPQCPSYELIDLSRRYDLRPGKYVIRAVRRSVKLISWEPYKAERLADIVSNDVRPEVTVDFRRP